MKMSRKIAIAMMLKMMAQRPSASLAASSSTVYADALNGNLAITSAGRLRIKVASLVPTLLAVAARTRCVQGMNRLW